MGEDELENLERRADSHLPVVATKAQSQIMGLGLRRYALLACVSLFMAIVTVVVLR